MHSVELLEEAIRAAGAIGYGVRQEWLDGAGGGDCEIRGRKCLFLDLSQGVHERLQLVLRVLRREGAAERVKLTEPLARVLGVRQPGDKAA
ncbi:MAG TPA: hypothetical protein VG125_11465 [Pirellulales bacterium]|jgi:hypothetical protein|nr:hypothetical protein [Pirellulales bacterium]